MRRPDPAAQAAPRLPDPPVQFLVESQGRPGPGTATRFLQAARHLAVTGTPTVVFLIDDGVRSAVGVHPDLARIVEAGGSVWADEASLAQRDIPADALSPDVLAVGLDKVAPLLFDSAVRVVWR